MKITSAEANKMIRQLKDQYRMLYTQEGNVVSFIAATTENIEDVRPAYSYEETAAKFEKACICPEHMPVCMCGGNHQRLRKVNRKPILPTNEEIARNSRARSAKLRVYERV